jgi:hypothetical protein
VKQEKVGPLVLPIQEKSEKSEVKEGDKKVGDEVPKKK